MGYYTDLPHFKESHSSEKWVTACLMLWPNPLQLQLVCYFLQSTLQILAALHKILKKRIIRNAYKAVRHIHELCICQGQEMYINVYKTNMKCLAGLPQLNILGATSPWALKVISVTFILFRTTFYWVRMIGAKVPSNNFWLSACLCKIYRLFRMSTELYYDETLKSVVFFVQSYLL